MFRFLFPVGNCLAVGAIFGTVPTGNERLAAANAVAKLITMKDAHFERVSGDDLHQNEAKESAAHGSGMELRTGDRLAVVEKQAVTIMIKMTVTISNQPLDRPPLF